MSLAGSPIGKRMAIPAGSGDDAALYVVDGRDVVTGLYEAVTVAPPLQAATSLTVIEQSPLVITGSRDAAGITITLQNADSSPVTTEPFVVLVGAERAAAITGHGGTVDPVTFGVPDWAIHATVDLSMDPAQWPRFTDFGLTPVRLGRAATRQVTAQLCAGPVARRAAGTGLVRRSRAALSGSGRAGERRAAGLRPSRSASMPTPLASSGFPGRKSPCHPGEPARYTSPYPASRPFSSDRASLLWELS